MLKKFVFTRSVEEQHLNSRKFLSERTRWQEGKRFRVHDCEKSVRKFHINHSIFAANIHFIAGKFKDILREPERIREWKTSVKPER